MKKTNGPWPIGKAILTRVEEEISFEGKPTGKQDAATGLITTYLANTSDLSSVVFGVVTWPDGTSEVVPIDVLPDGELKYERLANAGRMTLLNVNESWLGELNAMKFNPEKGRFNLASVDLGMLDNFVETGFEAVLQHFGQVQIATRLVLHGETNRNRERLAFMCLSGDKDLVAAVYVVTRVLAIMKDFGM